ncbi:MAG: Ldh family oxidoreductase [Planctomycetia bacterium]|nr:Ldh family oxidoreductase [Planctomycetia bacterium]
MPTLSAETLLTFTRELFEAAAVPADEAAIVSASLVDANLVGHDSHGVIRVMQYNQALADGILRTGVSLKILHETPAVATANGQWGLGQVQAHRLLDLVIPKARALGVAAGTLYQCGHIGRLGEYGERAAREGLALFGTVNNHGFGRAVAPPGGKAGRIGTNPLCLAAPTRDEPVVLDIGTSVCAEGKVRVLYNKGVPVPEGWLLDADGKPTTNPGVLYHDPRGTIQPLGGSQAYKGFGLGLLLDMLAGGLSGSPCSRPEIGARSANAVVFALFDPAQFAGIEHFCQETGDLAANVRSSPPVTPGTTITLPGDPERLTRERRRREGITLDDGTWGQLTTLADRLKVKVPV